MMPKVLVTGATGFLGRQLVKEMTQRGYRVRALARKHSDISTLTGQYEQIVIGDISEAKSLAPAFAGIDFVVHAAADTTGDELQGRLVTIQGTENIINLCEQEKIKKLIYISSCSVYGVSDYKKGEIVTEDSPLERFPEKRGHYSYAKFMAEKAIRDAISSDLFPITVLRPGTIFGPGGPIYTPLMGFSIGTRLFGVIGDGSFVLPLVFIYNLVDCIIAALENENSNGRIYNVVDGDAIDKRTYMQAVIKKIYPQSRCFYIPYYLLYIAVYFQETVANLLRIRPFLTRYRLICSQKHIIYDATKLMNELKWTPALCFREAIQKVIEYHQPSK